MTGSASPIAAKKSKLLLEPAWLQYLLAVAGVALATLVRLPLQRLLHDQSPYSLFYLPILLTACFCGVGPTLVAIVLAAASALAFFVSPEQPGFIPALVLFAAISSAIMVIAFYVRRTRATAEAGDTGRAYLAAITASSDDAIITKNLDGVIEWCNAAAERIFGYAAAELVGRSVSILIPPDRQAEETAILSRLVKGERVDHFETVRLAKDGHPIDVSLTISPVRDGSGTIIGASKVARDITDQKRAAALLAAQREWFQVTLSSIGDGVIACDVSLRVTFMNGTAEKLTGWMLADAIGRPVVEIFHLVDETTRTQLENPCAKVIQSGQIRDIGSRAMLLARDGNERPIADSAAPIRDAHGATIGVVLVFHDISARRRIEAAMIEQREWLETTLRSIGDAVIATDDHGAVVFMNPIAEKLTGWSAEAARGRSCKDIFNIVNEQTRETVINPIDRVLVEGTIVGLANHTVLIAADGTERPIDDSGAPIKSQAGKIVGAVLVFRDITERRRREQDRATNAAEREKLLEAERRARTDAERASRAKDDFVAMVSHELRTPLNVILGWTKLLKGPPVKPRETIERGLEVVERNTRIQAQLISDLLDMSRVIAGKMRIEMEYLDAAAIVQEATQTVQPAATAKQINIHRALDTTVGPILADPARLNQCVWNLLSNAIKFTPDGGNVNVTLRRDGSNVEIIVSDDGIGIPADLLPSIFERFRQGEDVTTRRYGGLGLGLAIVKELVQAHGGTVRAESAGEDKGATFRLLLPIGHAGQRPTIRATVAERPVSLKNVRVLLVEDDADTRDLLRRLLEEHQADVRAIGSAQSALDTLTSAVPNIIVCDIGLPDIDGYELIRRVRRLDAENGGTVPAIAVTAYARPEDRTSALRAGYQAHIAKPIEPSELVSAIARLVDAAR